MKPDFGKVMHGFFGTLLMDVAPNLTPGYATGSVGLMGLMLFMGAEEYERGAAVRVADNQDMRELFAEAAGRVEDMSLKQRLGEAAESMDESLNISALEESNARLKALLIDLQSHVEQASGATAAELEDRIWAVLVASCNRRKLTFPILG